MGYSRHRAAEGFMRAGRLESSGAENNQETARCGNQRMGSLTAAPADFNNFSMFFGWTCFDLVGLGATWFDSSQTKSGLAVIPPSAVSVGCASGSLAFACRLMRPRVSINLSKNRRLPKWGQLRLNSLKE